MCQSIKNFFHLCEAIVATMVYRFPSKNLTVIGVTGTDGKTTTVNLIHHILTESGYKAAVVSTISSAHTTTPDSWKLQKFLSQSLKNGCTHVVLEVSSHAIDQHRIWGIKFAVGVLTNIAENEHLDYHKTFENYKNTKLKFLKACGRVADWKEIKNFHFQTNLLGEFNRQNILAATAVCRILNISDADILKGIKSFIAPPGRLEIVVKKPFIVIVDFAHTPQAFEVVLPEVKKLACLPAGREKGRLIHVFGATGDRDKSKRPIMGKIASQYDDVIILTSEDTYSEDREDIINQIEKGVTYKGETLKGLTLLKCSDRREAIQKALEIAQPGDVVLLTGVGHQRSMNIAGQEVPWNEPKIVKEILHDTRR